MNHDLIDHTDKADAVKKNVENIEHTGMIELAPRKPTESGSPLAGRAHAKKVCAARIRFRKRIEPYHCGGALPFSIISCILELPEHAKDWESPMRLRQVLTSLLADCGFWFDEMRPTACGQREMRDLAPAIIDENNTLHSVYELEASLQSRAQLDFFKLYSENGEQPNIGAPPRLVRELEQLLGPDGVGYFRKYVTCAIQKTRSTEDLQCRLEKLWLSLCDIPLELLEKPLKDTNGVVAEDSRGNSVTLRQAQRNMTNICKQILDVHRTEVKRLYSVFSVSEAEYERYRNMMQMYCQLLNFWRNSRAIICSCNQFPNLLKQRILEIYQQKESGANAAKRQSSTARIQISHFTQSTGQFPVLIIKSCAQKLCTCFCDFFNKTYGTQMFAEMEKIIAFSCDEVFCIEDSDDPENLNDHHLAMAPVITYLFFSKYSTYLAKGDLKSVGLETFFNKTHFDGSKSLSEYLNLYDKICQIYRMLYGERYTTTVQAEWDAVFLSCSGLCNNGKDFFAFTKAWHGCIGDRGLPFPFSCVSACLNANHADLLHVSVIRNGMIKCTDPEARLHTNDKQVFEFFRTRLVENGDVLSGYLKKLEHGNSHAAMNLYLEKHLNTILAGEENTDADTTLLRIHCQEIFEQYHLQNLNIQERELQFKIVPATYCQIVLEYVMREMLFEQCGERLYNWLIFCINKRYEVKCLDRL